jgi:hypothetical protein
MLSPAYAAAAPGPGLFLRDLPTAGWVRGPGGPVDEEDLVDTGGLTPPSRKETGCSDESQAAQEQAGPAHRPASRISPSVE